MKKLRIPMIIAALILLAFGALFIAKGQIMKKSPLDSEKASTQQASGISAEEVNKAQTNSNSISGESEKGSGVSQLSLSISEPVNNSTVTTSNIIVKGSTIPAAEVFINDIETKSNAKGDFSVTVPLDEGDNYIIVTVVDADGNFAENELSVTYEP